jgi:Stress responsive A/B Barrel Domain.
MIKHIVVWKLKEEAKGKPKSENAVMLKHELESLTPKIKEIRKFEVGINFNTQQDAYDLGLVSEFANKDDLDTYLNHPEHQRVAGIVRRVRESRIVVDYEM